MESLTRDDWWPASRHQFGLARSSFVRVSNRPVSCVARESERQMSLLQSHWRMQRRRCRSNFSSCQQIRNSILQRLRVTTYRTKHLTSSSTAFSKAYMMFVQLSRSLVLVIENTSARSKLGYLNWPAPVLIQLTVPCSRSNSIVRPDMVYRYRCVIGSPVCDGNYG